MKLKYAGILDVISIGSQRDCAVVFPTLNHALAWWPILRTAFIEYHGQGNIHGTKTAIVSIATNTAVRLWVPYAREPTLPMDYHVDRRHFTDYLNLYGMYQGGLV